MTLGILPAIAIVLLIILSPAEKKQEPVKKEVPKSVVFRGKSDYKNVESKEFDEQAEYETILGYIKSRYNKIQKQDAEQISHYLVNYGKMHDLDPKFAAAVIARESAFNKKAISSTGAKGLGQIKDFNYKSLKIEDPFNIKENVSGTTEYLKKMLKNWDKTIDEEQKKPEEERRQDPSQIDKVKLALASYYKGFTAVKNEDGKLDEKTQGYVQDILKNYEELINERNKTPNKKPK